MAKLFAVAAFGLLFWIALVNADCTSAGVALQSDCSSLTSELSSNKGLSTASDATIKAAADAAKVKPSSTCCSALKTFDSGNCGCDSTVVSLAQSTQHIDQQQLLTTVRVGLYTCSTAANKQLPAKKTCPASG